MSPKRLFSLKIVSQVTISEQDHISKILMSMNKVSMLKILFLCGWLKHLWKIKIYFLFFCLFP